MEQKEYCMNLLSFHSWRQEKISTLLMGINPEAFSKQLTGSFGSLVQILNHIVWAEKTWFCRVDKNEIETIPDLDVGGLLKEWKTGMGKWKTRIENWTTNDSEKSITYFNTEGGKFSNSLLDIVMHMVDHSTYHIGQLINAVRSLGFEPVQTNFIHYLRSSSIH